MAKRWTIEEDKCIRRMYERLSVIGHALRATQSEFREIVNLLNKDGNEKVCERFAGQLTSFGVMMNMTVKTIEPVGRAVQKLVIEQRRAEAVTGEIVTRRAKRKATRGGK